MNTTEHPAPPHPSLLELDGRAYKDSSRPAAALRAAYYQARAARSLAVSNTALPAERARMAAGVGNHYVDFSNFGTSADWIPDGGTQEPGAEGWLLHSHGNASSRVMFKYPLNDGSSPHTVVRAWFRGAHNNGKNSYVTLIEQFCADNCCCPPNCCDEIDIVEYYGQPSASRSEFTIHQNGRQPNVGFFKWPTEADPGDNITSYSIYLEPGNYLSCQLQRPDGFPFYRWDRHSSDGYVPSRSMNLYVGIWDRGSANPPINTDPPGSVTGDTWCALNAIQVWTDF